MGYIALLYIKNLLRYLIWSIVLLDSCQIKAIEFVYPVALSDIDSLIYMIYQKSLTHLELWLWNYKTHAIRSGLAEQYTPASISIVPNKQCFSFIDNGLVKVQSRYEPSPVLLTVSSPIYNITRVHWLTDTCCYFSAKERNCYGVYQLNINGKLTCLARKSGADCLYPQKINDNLFYILRSREDNFSANFKIVHDLEDSPILNFGSNSIAFLYMESENQGFFVEYSHEIRKESPVTFWYHRLVIHGDTWQSYPLFSFTIPSGFLFFDHDMRLYESILPLLPRHAQNNIYFVDCAGSSQNLNLNIFRYDLASEKIQQLTFACRENEHYFAPLIADRTMFYGGTLLDDKCSDKISLFQMDVGYTDSLV